VSNLTRLVHFNQQRIDRTKQDGLKVWSEVKHVMCLDKILTPTQLTKLSSYFLAGDTLKGYTALMALINKPNPRLTELTEKGYFLSPVASTVAYEVYRTLADSPRDLPKRTHQLSGLFDVQERELLTDNPSPYTLMQGDILAVEKSSLNLFKLYLTAMAMLPARKLRELGSMKNFETLWLSLQSPYSSATESPLVIQLLAGLEQTLAYRIEPIRKATLNGQPVSVTRVKDLLTQVTQRNL